jgi:hypothetical protein
MDAHAARVMERPLGSIHDGDSGRWRTGRRDREPCWRESSYVTGVDIVVDGGMKV